MKNIIFNVRFGIYEEINTYRETYNIKARLSK